MSKPITIAFAAALLLAAPALLHAEEGGSAHYLPGQAASFIDALPMHPGPVVENVFTWYDASTNASIPVAGLLARISATVEADSPLFLYQFDSGPFGSKYAVAASIPFISLEVKGSLVSGVGSFDKVDHDTAIGDTILYPLMLGWQALGGDLKYDLRFGIYAPTGDYRVGSLANTGKNYWSFEPGVMVSYLSSKLGIEGSLYTGFDINTKNDDTDYDSGSSWHMDLTVAEHLPLFGGIIGAGFSQFTYYQITDDSGSGAVLGGFKGHTIGIGPVLSYVYKISSDLTLATELKWLPELDVQKRLEGDYIWWKLALLF